MIIKKYENREEWLADRAGRITGTKLKDLIMKRGNGKKIGFYQLIADRLAIPADDMETPMDRGVRLESEGIKAFIEETKHDVDASLVMWQRDDNHNIAYSPDGVIGKHEAVEVKCLASARHIEALITKAVPKDYEDQVLQAFIVNEELETLYLVFYDDRLLTKKFFYLTIERDHVKVAEYLDTERKILEEVDKYVAELSEF